MARAEVAGIEPAIARVPPLGRRHVEATAVECPGPPLRPAGCRAHLNRRRQWRLASEPRGGGSASPRPPLNRSGRPAAPFAALRRPGPYWPGARGDRATRPEASGRLRCARSLRPALSLRCLRCRQLCSGSPARTPLASLRRKGCAQAVADRSGDAALR